jgi:two-component system, chemotaxis family, chemotaxis protein CheY
MKTFLVIEDSSVIRKVARRILDGLEFEIAEAENGEEAVEACRKRMPEGILLDWNMPKWTATISCARCVGFQGATGRRS